MTKPPRHSIDSWLNAGLYALSHDGPSALKAEKLARRLKTTKGSFYWHFRDIAAYQSAILTLWENRATTDIITALAPLPDARQRLRKLAEYAAEDAPDNVGGAALEPAIRAWALSDPRAARAVEQVDAARITYLQEQLHQLGFTNPDFARLIYAAHIGLSDLALHDDQPSAPALSTLVDIILALE